MGQKSKKMRILKIPQYISRKEFSVECSEQENEPRRI
jgi:hypothetical protein